MLNATTHRGEASPDRSEAGASAGGAFPARAARLGQAIPDIGLGLVRNGRVEQVSLKPLLAHGRSVVVGIVGAFAPACSEKHLPELIERATELGRMGYSQIYCVAPNDPFVLGAWIAKVDPKGRLNYLSDGNLDFGAWLGVVRAQDRPLLLGRRSDRYLMLVADGIIERLSVDSDPLSLACTRATTITA